jgi:hypothetical protein
MNAAPPSLQNLKKRAKLDFVVADPDGNLIHFASRVGEP